MKSPRGLFVAFMRHVRVSGHPRRNCGERALCSFIAIARKRAVFALRAEFLFLSFPKEKGTKKKGSLRAQALKDPLIVQSCYAQSKTSCLSSPQLQIALCRPLGWENCTKREEKVGATIGRPRLRRVLPRLRRALPRSCIPMVGMLLRLIFVM